MKNRSQIQALVHDIYGPRQAPEILQRFEKMITTAAPAQPADDMEYFSEKDVVLITYGDSLRQANQRPLETLHHFAADRLADIFSAIHILPFYPYSSDDGFSVIDFFAVDPDLGRWEDIQAIGADFDLMFDLVANHFSAASEWFQNYLAGIKGFDAFALETDPALDLTKVTRPRTHPLLTPFTKKNGQQVHLWTTFSADQIDFNYRSADVFECMLDVLRHYVNNGARLIRLDAIAFLWKEIGTSCLHLPQTHKMIQLFRKFLDEIAPRTVIITETNVPHPENISYFGDGHNEAQLVYNFTLPPLLLHTFTHANAAELSRWAGILEAPSPANTFFNFTASHDGIGVRPLEGILDDTQVDQLIDAVKKNGGRVSYKQNEDDSQSPYELNIAYVDAMRPPSPQPELHAARFLASQAIQLSLPGVPGIYIHSLLGSQNWVEGVEQSGIARRINRAKLDYSTVAKELADGDSLRSRIFTAYCRMIRIRRQQPAFHPNAAFEVLDLADQTFAFKRWTASQKIIVITNVSGDRIQVALTGEPPGNRMTDLLSNKSFDTSALALAPYQFVWLAA